ncbi:potassium transporter TrkA [Actinomycetota bacterium]
MKKGSIKERIRYTFDNLISKGTVYLIGTLAVASLIFIIIFSLIVWAVKLFPGTSYIELLWISLMRTFDADFLGDGGSGVPYIILTIIIALVSIFIISILIGILTAGIEDKIWSLRKGKSKVLESNHTVILGWNEMIYTIVEDLIEANKNQRKASIVIMGELDKVDMEDAIRDRIPDSANTRIVARQGNPIDITDLKMVNLKDSSSVIIIEDADTKVIKTILAIVNNPEKREKPYHIIAMLNEHKSIEAGKIAGNGQVEFIYGEDFISRITAQTCRQPGLSLVYDELLKFSGDEIYFSKLNGLTGKTFREALYMFEDSSLIGISSKGKVRLKPPMDHIIMQDDEIIVISEDDDTIKLSSVSDYGIADRSIIRSKPEKGKKEKTLILGWNEKGPTIINEIDNYVSKGSVITVVSDIESTEEELKEYCYENIKNQKIEYIEGDIDDRELLNKLTSKKYNHIIILSYHNREKQEADAITLMSLIHLRDIADNMKISFSLTSEMVDIRNQDLARIAKVNDFIVSDKLLSLMLTQISENKKLGLVFDEILDEEGSEIYIKNISEYIKTDQKVNFYTILEATSRRNEIAIGYKILNEEDIPEKNYGVYLNPVKSDEIRFDEKDSVIVLAE